MNRRPYPQSTAHTMALYITWAIAGLTAAMLLRCCATASAQDSAPSAPASNASDVARAVQPPGAGGVDTDALDLARGCYVEAAFRRADCAAIFWVATKLAAERGTGWAEQLNAYAAHYKGRTDRAREVAAWPWGDVPGKPEHFNRKWAAHRAYVAELIAGQHASPCPRGVVGWGGSMDSVKPGQVPVVCSGTRNWFYRRGVVSAKEAMGTR